MSLTKDDLKAIKGVIVETVQPIIDKLDDKISLQTESGLEEIRQSVREVQSMQKQQGDQLKHQGGQLEDQSNQLARIENKLNATVARLDDHGDRIDALEKTIA